MKSSTSWHLEPLLINSHHRRQSIKLTSSDFVLGKDAARHERKIDEVATLPDWQVFFSRANFSCFSHCLSEAKWVWLRIASIDSSKKHEQVLCDYLTRSRRETKINLWCHVGSLSHTSSLPIFIRSSTFCFGKEIDKRVQRSCIDWSLSLVERFDDIIKVHSATFYTQNSHHYVKPSRPPCSHSPSQVSFKLKCRLRVARSCDQFSLSSSTSNRFLLPSH